MNDVEFAGACLRLGVKLDRAQISAFDAFEADLYAQNEVMNLTRVPREWCRVRHFLDSLLVAQLISQGAHVLDVGSGPGFPAWPLALARPDLRVTALDSSAKMLGFLLRHPLPNLRTVLVRAEEWDAVESFDVVTGRALAPLAAQLELSAKPCKIGGRIIPLRTMNDRDAAREVPCFVLGLRLVDEHVVPLPLTDVVRFLPVFVKERPTPSGYPRPWGKIKVRPLV